MANTSFITTYVQGRSVEEARLAHILEVQRYQARSGGTAKEISSRIANAAEAHGAENVLDVGCWVGGLNLNSNLQLSPTQL